MPGFWYPYNQRNPSYMYIETGHILRKVCNCRERKNFRPPNILKFPVKKCFISQNFRRPFFSDFLHFLCFSPSKRCRYNCTNQLFASFILKISRFSAFFSTLFHCSSSTAQFPFYNCKLHFTNAHIVISCTLKYALCWERNVWERLTREWAEKPTTEKVRFCLMEVRAKGTQRRTEEAGATSTWVGP